MAKINISKTCDLMCTGKCVLRDEHFTYFCYILKLGDHDFIRLDAESSKYIRKHKLNTLDIIKLMRFESTKKIKG